MSLSTPRFNFFEKEIVKDPARENQVFDLLKDVAITCSSAGRGQLVIGDNDGNVIVLDKMLTVTGFPAYTRTVTHIQQMKQNNICITIGIVFESGVSPLNSHFVRILQEDSEADIPLLKIWHMDRWDGKETPPYCSRIIRLTSAKESHAVPVSTFTVHENMQLIAVGFTDGNVALFRGDITKDRHSKQVNIKPSSTEITGLAFRLVNKLQLLFITTTTTVGCYNIATKDKEFETMKENYGCALKCCAMTDETLEFQFLLGRMDGVYFLQPEGRGATAPLEGEKYQIHYYRGYLVVVGKSNINRDMDIVTIYDTMNKHIAYSGPVPHVTNVLFEWGAIYVLGGDNRLYLLQEKATQTKLEILFKKNQYQTAINIAKSQHYDVHGLVDIFRLYGDYLYKERGDHDGAIEQYIKTIGKLEPSYVIRRFLDAQRIHNLTRYLEELHNKHYATEDHTTLLLNCYTKLKDEGKLDEFIQKKDRNNEVNFEIETAIRVLRQADYHEHALQLAERHEKHNWYMRIQLENIKDFKAALRYMDNLSFEEAEDNLKKYGRILVNAVPRETTAFLKRLCLGEDGKTNTCAHPDEYIHIFVNNSAELMSFLEAIIHGATPDRRPASVVYNTLLELYLQAWGRATTTQEKELKEKKCKQLLEEERHYDQAQALVLCQMLQFKPGILYLYEQGHLYQQIVRYYMSLDEYSAVIDTCKKFGHLDSHLWVMALSYFAKKEDDCKTQMREVLTNINEKKLLPPLLVIQTLANSRVCTLGVIKDFIMNRLQAENVQIEADEKKIQENTEETKRLRQKIEDLKYKPQVFQVSRCSVCNHHLELPSIHFLCQHSYHQHCFESYAENENECPACVNENRGILEKIRQQEKARTTDLAREFQAQIGVAGDGFDVVAEYFGKGVFNQVTLLSDPSASNLTPREETLDLGVTTSSIKVARKNPFGSRDDGPADSAGAYRTTAGSGSTQVGTSQPAQIPQAGQSYEQVIQSPTHYSSSPQQVDVISMKVNRPADARRTEPVTRPIKTPSADTGAGSRITGSPGRGSTDKNLNLPAQGHKRQSSAGRVMEAGLNLLKGHRRQGSDQRSQGHSRQGSDQTRGHSRQGSDQARNPASELVRGHSKQSSDIRPAENPFISSSNENRPKIVVANPFEEPVSEQLNPFVESSAPQNLFEADNVSSNPFEEEPPNPFEEADSRNPFESESANPFE